MDPAKKNDFQSVSPAKLYSVDEAKILTGLGVTSFYVAINDGRLGAVKVGRRTFVPGAEIIRFRESLPAINRKPVFDVETKTEAA